MSTGMWLAFSLVFSSIGLGYFIYGKKQGRMVHLLSGIALMAYPYVIHNPFAFFGLGVPLLFLPFVLRV